MEYGFVISTMTLAEFKAFKKAVRVLCAAGMDRQSAIDTLIAARLTRADRYAVVR